MGFLSSFFGFGDKPTTTSSNVIPKYPEELKPYIEEAMKANQEIYKQRLEGGYQPYTGQTIAGFTPEEIASQEGLKSLVGTQAPLQQEALDLARGTARQFTPETAQEYMSPYLRTALDAQKQEAQRQYERTAVPQFEADAVRAGGMSGLGSRAGVEAAERDTGQNRLLANIEAQGQQKAFQAAQDAFRDQTTRERQAATQISTAAPNIFKSALSEQGLLQTMGEQKRDLGQSTLDEAYLKYIEQQQFPESQLARYQSSIYGNPLLKQPSYNKTGTSSGGGPGLGKTLLGLGTAAMGFGGSGGIGSSIFKGITGMAAGGGGVASTMKAQEYINRNMGGPVMPIVYRQTNGSIRSGGGYDYNNMLKDKGLSEAEIAIKKGKNLKKIAEAFKNIPKYNAPSRVGGLARGSVSSPLPTVEAQPNRQTTATDRAGLASLGGVTDDKLKEAYASEAQQLRRDDPNSVLSQSKNEMALIAGLDPQAGRDFAESGVADESGDAITNLENKLVDQQSLATGTDSGKKTGPLGMKSPKEAEQIATTATKKMAQSTLESALAMRNINKKTSTEVKGLLNSFAERYKARAENDPYKMQKFYFTLSAAMMEPGNVFANIPKGLSKAINELDATRKEKDKLLMDLDDTMTKAKIKLAGKEGESDIAYEKLNLAQKKMIDNLGPTGLAAFNKQMKANGDYIAALAAAKKAENAARKIDAKERKANTLKPAARNALTKRVTGRLTEIASPYFRNGIPIGAEASKWKRVLDTAYQKVYIEQGPEKADEFLTYRINEDERNFKTLFKKKKN